ncbi:MAG: D-alanyl-D-alanine dipeptidase [Candidatus Marsarchaeota archaeon]|jgi:D-alanyl-D-alanine dipeptidase|nr:D-alanyl-D-alanine dipeptidase [Candidatus Marsarchaeota archaeon]MCL5418592.1 D-alanyl-D-alanine dipeptidase [Candidatus Marsarchaeota archaeon]
MNKTKEVSSFEERLAETLRRTEVVGEAELDRIKVVECKEPLVKLTDYCDVVISMSQPRLNFELESGRGNELYARRTVAKMLLEAEASLPDGYRFVVFDAFRPVDYQARRFKERFEKFAKEFPDKSEQEIREITFTYIFPPSADPLKASPHSTGGAIDLTISYKGKPLDMGTEYANYDKNRDLILTNSKLVSAAQRDNRIFFVKTMLGVGFANYPGEWWHFMYGDREWVAYDHLADHAIYGGTDFSNVSK